MQRQNMTKHYLITGFFRTKIHALNVFFVKELSTILSKIPYLGGKKYIWPMKFVKENFDMLKGLYTV